jgi:histidine triad (HIT) family protein
VSVGDDGCIFCRIAGGEIEAEVLHRDEWVTAFRDNNPQAPVHVLVIPNEHVPSIAQVEGSRGELVVRMIETANRIAREDGIAEDGYRLVINQGRHGGQSVDHVHLHLLGGRSLGWPPG